MILEKSWTLALNSLFLYSTSCGLQGLKFLNYLFCGYVLRATPGKLSTGNAVLEGGMWGSNMLWALLRTTCFKQYCSKPRLKPQAQIPVMKMRGEEMILHLCPKSNYLLCDNSDYFSLEQNCPGYYFPQGAFYAKHLLSSSLDFSVLISFLQYFSLSKPIHSCPMP